MCRRQIRVWTSCTRLQSLEPRLRPWLPSGIMHSQLEMRRELQRLLGVRPAIARGGTYVDVTALSHFLSRGQLVRGALGLTGGGCGTSWASAQPRWG